VSNIEEAKGRTGYQSGAVDYLTVTTKTDKASANMIHSLLSLKESEFWIHQPNKPWRFKGYAGKAYEGIRYGLRGEEAIVMLSGPTCQALWSEVAPLGSKCTRIDLAVTITLKDVDLDVARDAYGDWLKSSTGTGSMVVSSRGGQTCYIGSRQSTTMARIYDKGAEQHEEAGRVWRYEIEAKKPITNPLLARLLETDDVPGFIFSYVGHWLEGRGIKPRWFATNMERAIEIESHVTSVEKQLVWLRTQVRPTVGKLIIAGQEAEVYKALGLPLLEDERLKGWD